MPFWYSDAGAPCKNCKDRYVGCHGSCEQYQAFHTTCEKDRAERNAMAEISGAIMASMAKKRDRLRRKDR